MADLAAFRGSDAAGLTGGVRREIVVVDVMLGRLRVERIQLLLHLQHVQGGHTEDLGLAALEQGGAVGARNQFDLCLLYTSDAADE